MSKVDLMDLMQWFAQRRWRAFRRSCVACLVTWAICWSGCHGGQRSTVVTDRAAEPG